MGATETAVGGGYKTPAEEEHLTPGEQRFEKARRTTGLVVGPLLFLIVYFAPLGLERPQQSLAAIFLMVIVLWMTEAIPIPITAVLV
jgi:sodium-dependent dicarboxylate transporter 2/3/5